MATIKFEVTVTEDTNQQKKEIELSLDVLRKTPNPRQAVMSFIKELTNTTLASADIDFSI
jgi:hypothetical protein